jgi:hypothetical protein
MKLIELFEAENTHITFCFGRMNPPTIGHKQLLDTVAGVGGKFSIFVSQTQDKKKNPLDYQTKIKFMKAMFPQYAKNIVDDANLNTIGKVASYLYDMGYRNATFVAGSDRLEDMKNLLTTYNGVEGKAHGFYKFDLLDFKSSGDREDGAEGVAGVSASNARAAAANGDFKAFQESTGAGQHAEALYKAVRDGMGIKDQPAQEDAAGVGIVNKQNSTKDVGPGTLRKNLKAFNLVGNKKMKAEEFTIEHKKGRKAVKHNPKPRSPVAHAAQSVIGGSASGAHKDKTKEIPRHQKHKTVDVVGEGYRDPEDWDEGNTEPPNNFAVYINGKKWKVFAGRGTYADDMKERQHYRQLQDWAAKKTAATGKKWTVHVTGEAPTA